MSNSLILNSSNIINNNNNTLEYKFINGNFKVNDNSSISLSSIVIPYSWFNVTTEYNNTKMLYRWPTGGTFIDVPITLPDGFYTVNDLNDFLHLTMLNNNHYLINDVGENVYYIELSYNVTYYACQLVGFTVPTSLPTGWTAPAGFPAFPTVATSPAFGLPFTGSVRDILGFQLILYGGTTSNYSRLSETVPKGSTVNSIVVRCSLVNNAIASPTDIIDSFPINTTFGSNINYVPNFEKWIKIRPGNYSSFTITLYDQDLKILKVLDPNMLITLMIKQE
jgi:hypothetical protein